MSPLQEKLPRFRKPPVVEVVLSAQFQALPNFTGVEMVLAWQRFRSRFPRTEQHPPIPHTIERKGARTNSGQVQISIQPVRDLTPRMWMLNGDGTELIQVQQNRFIRNWRRQPGQSAAYPQYSEHLRPEFIRDFSEFELFLADEGIGPISFDQCEVTYINHIGMDGVWQHHGQLDKVIRGWSSEYARIVDTEMESAGWRA